MKLDLRVALLWRRLIENFVSRLRRSMNNSRKVRTEQGDFEVVSKDVGAK